MNFLTKLTSTYTTPTVLLPRWQAIICDIIKILSFGICKFRWNGITLDEWYGGFSKIKKVNN